MPTICLGTFSMVDAEMLLAKIWLRLERNGEATPLIHCEFHPDGSVGVWLACPDPTLTAGYVAVAAGHESVEIAA